MAENDIYNNEQRYKLLRDNLDQLAVPPENRKNLNGGKRKSYIKNRKNIEYNLRDYYNTKNIWLFSL